MSSKCWKNKKVAHEVIAVGVWSCSCHILMFSVIYNKVDTWQQGLNLFYTIKKQKNVNNIYASLLQYIISNQSKGEIIWLIKEINAQSKLMITTMKMLQDMFILGG